MMDANTIKKALMNRYSINPLERPNIEKGRDPWVVYDEFRATTDSWGYTRVCDLIAIRLYKGVRIIGHEIKVSRSDFKKDIENFDSKQGDFIDFVTEFYYVCPWKLILPDEVPEGIGLMWVNEGNKVIEKKKARFVNKDTMPFGTFKSFMARQARGVDRFSLPVKYLGKEVTEREFKAMVQEKVDLALSNNYDIRREAEFKKEVSEARAEYEGKLRQLRDIIPYGVSFLLSREEGDKKKKEFIEKVLHFFYNYQRSGGENFIKDYKEGLDKQRAKLDELQEIINMGVDLKGESDES